MRPCAASRPMISRGRRGRPHQLPGSVLSFWSCQQPNAERVYLAGVSREPVAKFSWGHAGSEEQEPCLEVIDFPREIDVGLTRSRRLQSARRGKVADSSICRFPDSPIPRLADSPTIRFPDFPIPRLPDCPIARLPDWSIPRFPDSDYRLSIVDSSITDYRF